MFKKAKQKKTTSCQSVIVQIIKLLVKTNGHALISDHILTPGVNRLKAQVLV